MKNSLERKRSSLALVAPAADTAATQNFGSNEYPLARSFRGWLSGIAPPNQGHHFRPLTTEDFVQVSLVTVRESNFHRHWPREVITKFMAAEVITNNYLR